MSFGKFVKKYLAQIIISVLLIAVFLVTVLHFVFAEKVAKREFLFPSADDKSVIVEYRKLPENPRKNDIQVFVEELLLGSSVERTKNLFTVGTDVLSCFEREGVLYLNLSSDLLFKSKGVVPIAEGADFLEKNIKLNFPEIKTVELYVDGNLAFEK